MTVPELQAKLSSDDFAEWCAFLQLEPDIGTRADGLLNVIADRLGRHEATFGGKPIESRNCLIEWGYDETDQQNDAIDKLANFFSG